MEALATWAAAFPWTSFATLTFRRPMRKDALRFARAWFRAICKEADSFGRIMCGEEWHHDGERLHLHALVYVEGGELLDLTTWWRWWYTRFGRARVERYDPSRGAAFYVAKYIRKEQNADWFLLEYGKRSRIYPLPLSLGGGRVREMQIARRLVIGDRARNTGKRKKTLDAPEHLVGFGLVGGAREGGLPYHA